jgi:ubiquitin-conjugating enzyme E2 O
MFDEGFSEEGSSMDDALIEGEEWLDGPVGFPLPPLPPYLMPPHFGGEADTGEGDEDGDEDEEISDAMISDTMDTYMDVTGMDPPQIPGGLPMDDTSTTPQISTTPVPRGPSPPQPTPQPHEPLRDSENDDLYWKRFDILSSAPPDHAFYSRPVAQPSRAFMARLHKEYRALSTGLPGILILIYMADPMLIPY